MHILNLLTGYAKQYLVVAHIFDFPIRDMDVVSGAAAHHKIVIVQFVHLADLVAIAANDLHSQRKLRAPLGLARLALLTL